MNFYLRMNASRLPTLIGISSPEGFLVSNGEGGTLSYGPYVQMDAGKYVAGYYIRRIGDPEPSNFTLDVFVDDTQLAVRKCAHQSLFGDLASFIYVAFELSDSAPAVEFRVHVEEGVRIELRELVVFQADQRNWSGE